MKIPPTRYYFPPESIDFILENFHNLLENGEFLTMGKHCEDFERKFAEYVGSRYAVSVSSGTAALEIIFRALCVKGYDVVVPTNTFAATVFALLRAGGRPIFVDCASDLTVDPDDVRKKITTRTRAVVTVHIGGLVSPYTHELKDVCDSKGIYFIEDAAHAHGSALDNKKAGTFGVAASFSFFPTKVMTTGEGGMITTNDEEVYRKALLLRDQAKVEGRNYHEEIGYNWRMTEFQALMGITQLENLERFIEKRNKIARTYDVELEKISSLSSLKIPNNVRHNFYKYIAFLEHYNQDELRRKLKAKYGISLGGYVYETPCHLQPVFKEYSQGGLPMSEDLCRRHICLPVYYTMTDDETMYVVNSLMRCLK